LHMVHCHSKTPSCLVSFKSRLVLPFDTGLSWKTGRLPRVVIVVVVLSEGHYSCDAVTVIINLSKATFVIGMECFVFSVEKRVTASAVEGNARAAAT